MTKLASKSNYDSDNVTHKLKKKTTIEIGDKFVKILQDNAFNGIDGGDVIDHIAKILEVLEWIKIPDVNKDQLRLHIFPISLSGHANEWMQYGVSLGLGYDILTTCIDLAVKKSTIWGQAPEKVTGVDLFYLCSMDRGTTNVPHLLARYMFRHAEGRKSGARLSGGHFIGCLAAHFGLLGRLNICLRIDDTWAWVAPRPKRQPDVTAGAPRAAEDAPADDEGAQVNPAPVQAPQPPPPAPRTIHQRISRLEEEAFDSTLVGSSQFPYQRRTRRRTDDASTSAPQQPDP
ncbi:hypothetical protein Tco_0557114 [Tanacetum coccineum]